MDRRHARRWPRRWNKKCFVFGRFSASLVSHGRTKEVAANQNSEREESKKEMSNDKAVKREHRFASEVRASSTDAGKKLSGYAAVFNVPTVIGNQFNEILKPGCFDACLAEDPDVRALWNHSELTVLGRTTAGTLRLRTDAKGLFYEIDLPATQAANDLHLSVSRKDVTGSSFGFFAVKENWIAATKPGELPTREILAANIFDVSPCSFPAYAEGTTVDARSLMPAALRDAMNTSNEGSLIPSGGVVPFQKHAEKRDDLWDETDAVNGIVNWATEDSDDRSAGTKVNAAKMAQGFAYVANDGSKRSDYLLPHHRVVDGKLAHHFTGSLRALGKLAVGKSGVPENRCAEVRQHLLNEMEVFNDSSDSGELGTEIERSKAR